MWKVIGKKLMTDKNGKFSLEKVVGLIFLLWILLLLLLFLLISIVNINTAGLTGKIQLEEMEPEEQQELLIKTKSWLEPYGDYMAEPPISSYNETIYQSLRNLKISNVSVPFQEFHINQLESVANPIMFFNSQPQANLSYGFIKALEVVAGIDIEESIGILQPNNISFITKNMDVTAKVVVRYDPQDPYFRLKDEKGNLVYTQTVVNNGDTLDSLAVQYETTVDEIVSYNDLKYQEPQKDPDGNVMKDTDGNIIYEDKIHFEVGMPIKFKGEIYQPPDKAIYEAKTFTYPVKLVEKVTTYNGKYQFIYYTDIIEEEIQSANNPVLMDREVDDDGQKESIKITIPVLAPPSEQIYKEDYSLLDELLIDKGFYDEDDQLLIFRQAIAYDPTFIDKRANSQLAQELLEQIGDLNESELYLVSVNSLSGLYCGQVPQEYFAIYQQAGAKYDVPWSVLAGIHKTETNFGTINPMISFRGAVGHMQFMESTWIGWAYPNRDKYGNIPDGAIDITNLEIIQQYGGYGVDGDGDGIADPFNPYDAIFTAGKYISANGGSSQDLYKAIYAYNHSDIYVNTVLSYAQLIATGGTNCSGGTSVVVDNEVIQKSIDYGYSLMGRTRYALGFGRTPLDRANGLCDCSSFVWYAYFQAGLDISPSGNCTANGYCGVSTMFNLREKGQQMDYNNIQIGDLIFFNTTGRVDSHVGIWIGNNQFIHCGGTSGVAIGKLEGNSYWYPRFVNNGSHVRRVAISP